MDALGGGAHGFLWWNPSPSTSRRRKRRHKDSNCNASSESSEVAAAGGAGYLFPFKQAATAGSLALAGDTIAQLTERVRACRNEEPFLSDSKKDVIGTLLSHHDWLRALRMTSYGFLFYGPGSYVWYRYLDRLLPQQTVENLLSKVLLNQIILGPCVIAVVFAWNNLWQGKLSKLPRKYQNDFLPTLLNGFRFWIPVSAVSFWYIPWLFSLDMSHFFTVYAVLRVIPLQARVAFMSLGSIFWNFVLSSTMSKS